MELRIKDKLVIFDDEDQELVMQYHWYVNEPTPGIFYAVTSGYPGISSLRMHNLVMGFTGGPLEVDHINRNGLDNRRRNLRSCSRQQNNANQGPRKGTSRYKGVRFNKGKWTAQIMIDRVSIHLGRHETELGAAAAYDKAAREAWGEFAYQNLEYDGVTR